MRALKTIFFFVLMNIAVLLMISTIFTVFKLEPYLTAEGINFTSLLVFSGIIGFTGALISLWMSRWTAKRIFSIRVIETPRTQEEILLYHAVESIANQAGISMPEVGIYPSNEVNAFATGATRNRSLVAVSQGLLDSFSPEEIQGVLAHEMSHVTSGDMMTMTLMQGVLNTFVIFVSRALAFVVESALGRDSKGINYLVYWLASMVFQVIFGLLAGLILMAFSRRREFFADAGGARFAGKNKMIAALRRLQQTTQRIDASPKQASFATFKITDKDSWLRLWRSHPSLEKRIERLQRLPL